GYSKLRKDIINEERADRNVVWGGEDSGHVLFTDNSYFDDGSYTALKMIALIATQDISLSSVLKLIPDCFSVKEARLKFKVANEEKLTSEELDKARAFIRSAFLTDVLTTFESLRAGQTPESAYQITDILEIDGPMPFVTNGPVIGKALIRSSLHEPEFSISMQSMMASSQAALEEERILKTNLLLVEAVMAIILRHPAIAPKNLQKRLDELKQKLQGLATPASGTKSHPAGRTSYSSEVSTTIAENRGALVVVSSGSTVGSKSHPAGREETGSPELNIIEEFLVKDAPPCWAKGENAHLRYAAEEKAILVSQRMLENRLEILEGELQAGKAEVLEAIAITLDKLRSVIKAREKFIRLGVPAYHTHTNLNDDGRLMPRQLLEHAVNNGITILYVTGHDRMEGSLEAMKLAEESDHIVDMRPGVEIDTPFLGASAITHIVVLAPQDKEVIRYVKDRGEEIFNTMQSNFAWRFHKFMELGDPALFDREWAKALESQRAALLELSKRLHKEGILSKDDDLEGLKLALKEWFSNVRGYVDANPQEAPREFYNKLDVLGNWTNALESWPSKDSPVWPKNKASARRKVMRVYFGLLYSDSEVETASGVAMERVEDIAGDFSKKGCRVILAHPSFELHGAGEIRAEDYQRFWDKVSGLAAQGVLHAVGAGWSIKEKAEIEDCVARLRSGLGKTEEDLPVVSNIPDYHGKDYPADATESIRLGILHTLKNETGGAVRRYWTWEDMREPDLENYFRDGRFLAAAYLNTARQLLQAGNCAEALRLTKIAYLTNRYDFSATASLRLQAYQGLISQQVRNSLFPEAVIAFVARRDQLPQRADLIIVLGSTDKRVPLEAAALFKRGLAPKILVSGNQPALRKGKAAPEAHIYRDILIREGVPPEAIIIEDESTSTEENLIFSKRILEARGIPHDTVILVQHPAGQTIAGDIYLKLFGREAINFAAYIPEFSKMSDKDLLKTAKRIIQNYSRTLDSINRGEEAISLPAGVIEAGRWLSRRLTKLMILDAMISDGEGYWQAKARAMIWLKLAEQGLWHKSREATQENIRLAGEILARGDDFSIVSGESGLVITEQQDLKKFFPVKPRLVALDVDGTLIIYGHNAKPRILSPLISLRRKAVDMLLNSGNSFKNALRRVLVFLQAELRNGIEVCSSRGIKITRFDRQGEPQKYNGLLEPQYVISISDYEAIKRISEELMEEWRVKITDADGNLGLRARFPGFYEGYWIDKKGDREVEETSRFNKGLRISHISEIEGVGLVYARISEIPSAKYALDKSEDLRTQFIKELASRLPADIWLK
ncbi:MAG: YdcF family protein, partial [Candidatus Omnitrophica bacterium]|nr:YdcF family protein [Candidatus Omnitrophota bacterium]